MNAYINMFEGAYNPFDALFTLLTQEKARVEKAIQTRGQFNPVP